MTLAIDLLVALALIVDGVMLAPRQQLVAVLTMALGVALMLARFVLERTTTRGAFGE